MVSIDTVLADNDYQYLKLVASAIEYSDPEAKVKLYKYNKKLKVHITPSDQIYREDIIKNVMQVNHRMGLKVIFSSSLKIQNNISYEISLVD